MSEVEENKEYKDKGIVTVTQYRCRLNTGLTDSGSGQRSRVNTGLSECSSGKDNVFTSPGKAFDDKFKIKKKSSETVSNLYRIDKYNKIIRC